jgi:cysteine synthase B
MVKRLAREEGLLVGISAGAAIVGCVQVAEGLVEQKQPAVIATILPDSGDKYLSERFWDE